MSCHPLCRLPGASGKVPLLLFLTVLVTACATHSYKLNIPSIGGQERNPYPQRVAVVAGEMFPEYEIKYRWWSTGLFTLKMKGLPDSLVDTLRQHFVAVEFILSDQTNFPKERYDLIAKMSVDRVDFHGARLAEFDDDNVNLDMTFMIERPDGTEVFRTTVSASASSRRERGPNGIPPAAFPEAFSKAFRQLSETLTATEIPSLRAQRDVDQTTGTNSR